MGRELSASRHWAHLHSFKVCIGNLLCAPGTGLDSGKWKGNRINTSLPHGAKSPGGGQTSRKSSQQERAMANVAEFSDPKIQGPCLLYPRELSGEFDGNCVEDSSFNPSLTGAHSPQVGFTCQAVGALVLQD